MAVATVTAEPPTMQDAGQLISQEKWPEVAEMLKQITKAEPENGQAWFYLGYSLHLTGKLKEALPAHEKAAEFPQFRAVSTYNIGCAYALLGDKDKAIEALERAIAAGSNDPEQFEGDSDLDSLRSDARFKKMMAKLSGTDTTPVGKMIPLDTIEAAHAFDFYVGQWKATSKSGTTTSLKVERVLGGKALRISGPTYAGLINFDPDANTWNWTWINRKGAHDRLQGGVEGDRLVMHQKSVRGKPDTIGRVTFYNVAEGSYDMDWELSTDKGKTWKLEHGAHVVRKERAGN